MCKTIYRYVLLTATSFGASGGLYLASLTNWLWPYPIRDYTGLEPNENWDYRDVLVYSGLIGFIIFTPGVLIVIRAKPKELQYYGIFLIIPFLLTLTALILQLCTLPNVYEEDLLFDPTDWYLFGVAFGLLAIIVNLFLFVKEINRYGTHLLISTGKHCEENAV